MVKELFTSQDSFPCLTVLCLVDSNLAGMETFYYYSRMTKQGIEKEKSDLDYQIVLPEILLYANLKTLRQGKRIVRST